MPAASKKVCRAVGGPRAWVGLNAIKFLGPVTATKKFHEQYELRFFPAAVGPAFPEADMLPAQTRGTSAAVTLE